MEIALTLVLEIVLGYILQMLAFGVGMHAVAKQKMDPRRLAAVVFICALLTYLIRNSDLFNFGVHTMLMLLIINASSILIAKINIRASILGSILMMILVLLSELVNVGIISIFAGADRINELLSDPITKAASAIPGNIVLVVVAMFMYYFRVHRKVAKTKNVSG